MEYAKDEIFQIKYNTKINQLQVKQERWTSKIYKQIKTHKMLITIIIFFLMFSAINIIMINSFFKILYGYIITNPI